jgi:hypothetical protein
MERGEESKKKREEVTFEDELTPLFSFLTLEGPSSKLTRPVIFL